METDGAVRGVPLGSLVKTLRSKNAGVDMVTFDVFFPTAAAYERVVASGALTAAAVARLYRIDEADIVTHVLMPDLHAVKFTIRRAEPSGSPGDADVFGSQQYAPLLDVIIP